jgi:hypothetical protein|tara:strand:- start:1376 stop:1522 length:147 start_codon:yes stop_codon:yes gene_type:complete
MASQGGGGGISKTDILKLLYGDTAGSAAPTTDGIGLQLDAALVNSGVN